MNWSDEIKNYLNFFFLIKAPYFSKKKTQRTTAPHVSSSWCAKQGLQTSECVAWLQFGDEYGRHVHSNAPSSLVYDRWIQILYHQDRF